jgi:hypothetical protein
MGTLIFVCPTTWHQVSTDVEVDIIQLQEPAGDEDGNLLSALSQEPLTVAYLGSVVWQCPGRPAILLTSLQRGSLCSAL